MLNVNLNFDDAYVKDEYLYFSASDFNGLFRLKKGESYAEWLGWFQKEPLWQKRIHYKIVEQDGRLFFNPFFGHGIHTYDLKKQDLKFYPFDDTKPVSFSNAIKSEGKIYLIPLNPRTPFTIYDMSKERARIDEHFWEHVRGSFALDEGQFIGGFGAVLAHGAIYMTIVNTNALLCYDVDSHKIRSKKLSYYPESIYRFNGCLYFTTLDSARIMKYDIKKEQSEELVSASCLEEEGPIKSLFIYQGKLFLLPKGRCENVLEVSFDRDRTKMRKIPLIGSAGISQEPDLYKNYLRQGARVLFLPKFGKGITAFNVCEKKLETYEVKCDPAHAELYSLLQKCNGMEQGNDDLEAYVKLILRDVHSADVIEKSGNENIGRKIWDIIRG